jgi:hypothetical protein
METARRKADYRSKKAAEANINLGKQCTKITGCERLHCYFCRTCSQRIFTEKFAKPLEAALEKNPGSWEFITIVPSYGLAEVGEEPMGGLRKFIEKMARQLRAADPNLSAVCVVDVSLNVDLDGFEYWQWHVHAVTTKLDKQARRRLRELVQGNWCRKPVLRKEIYYSKGILEYISKPDFFQRKDDIDEVTRKKNTRHSSMNISDELVLMKVLSQWTVGQRIFEIRDPLSAMKK